MRDFCEIAMKTKCLIGSVTPVLHNEGNDKNLPKYEITARDVKTGATWVCLSDTNVDFLEKKKCRNKWDFQNYMPIYYYKQLK